MWDAIGHSHRKHKYTKTILLLFVGTASSFVMWPNNFSIGADTFIVCIRDDMTSAAISASVFRWLCIYYIYMRSRFLFVVSNICQKSIAIKHASTCFSRCWQYWLSDGTAKHTIAVCVWLYSCVPSSLLAKCQFVSVWNAQFVNRNWNSRPSVCCVRCVFVLAVTLVQHRQIASIKLYMKLIRFGHFLALSILSVRYCNQFACFFPESYCTFSFSFVGTARV